MLNFARIAGRRCQLCGRIGGIGSTTILRMLGHKIPDGSIGYAHAKCIRLARAALSVLTEAEKDNG